MASNGDFDLVYKVVIVGDSGVGKTNILSRYLTNEFNFDSKTTVGVELGIKKTEIDGYNVKIQIWDTAGQERYRAITSAYYKGTLGALIVYDVTKPESFENINRWVPELKQFANQDVTIMLVGNKTDLTEERKVQTIDGSKKAKLYSEFK